MLVKSLLDENNYRFFLFPNGITGVLISNSSYKTSSCGVAIELGSINDPPEYYGLAKIVQQMLFYGTKSFTEIYGFENLLKDSEGRMEAQTDKCNSVFYVNIEHSHAKKMIERLSRFFIDPVFSLTTLDIVCKKLQHENSKE